MVSDRTVHHLAEEWDNDHCLCRNGQTDGSVGRIPRKRSRLSGLDLCKCCEINIQFMLNCHFFKMSQGCFSQSSAESTRFDTKNLNQKRLWLTHFTPLPTLLNICKKDYKIYRNANRHKTALMVSDIWSITLAGWVSCCGFIIIWNFLFCLLMEIDQVYIISLWIILSPWIVPLTTSSP